jgi:PAS domain S-box-containing protein
MLLEQRENKRESTFDVVPDGIIISDRNTGLIVRANRSACQMHAYACDELVGTPVSALMHPESRRDFIRQVEALVPGRGPLRIGSRHVRADGSIFHAEWHIAPLMLDGHHCWIGVLRDITDRMDAEQALFQHVSARTREQAALLEMSQALASSLEFQPGWVLDQLRKVVEYNRAGFFSLQGSNLVVSAMRGTPELEQAAPVAVNLRGADTLAQLFNAHRPILIPDWHADSLQARFLRSLLQSKVNVLLKDVRSWMWVPLAVRKRIIGGIGLAHAASDHYTASHAALALSVANQAAISMVNAELYKSAQTLAALQERQRLAQNLHDAVNQSLFSAGLIAEVLPRIWDQGQDMTRQSLEELSRLTRGAMAEMRSLLAELRPATLADAQLGELLRLLGNAFAGRTNVPTTVTVTGKGSLPADVQVTLYRICQEAITNIGKHADAQNVSIRLLHEGDDVDLRIVDDGCGFDPEAPVSGHYGLSMMRERAQGIGARLTITSTPGAGSEVRIRWLADHPESSRDEQQ